MMSSLRGVIDAAAVRVAASKAATLVEALPWLERFRGALVVVKYGGNAMTDDTLKAAFAQDIAFLRYAGLHPVVVHGGGPQIGELLKKVGKESKFIQGMRVTDEETMNIVEMVLVGMVNKEIVGLINRHGGNAVGLSGKDGRLIKADKYLLSAEKAKDTPPEIIDLGLVGKVREVDGDLLDVSHAEWSEIARWAQLAEGLGEVRGQWGTREERQTRQGDRQRNEQQRPLDRRQPAAQPLRERQVAEVEPSA